MAKKKIKILDYIFLFLVILGAINWGLFGAFDYNLVQSLLGAWNWIMKGIYILIGIAGVYSVYTCIKLLTK